jgi:MFS family permease
MRRRGLILGHPDFRRLWVGESVSQLGTQVSLLAIPFIAVVTLRATAFQTGLLTAIGYAAFLLLGLPAGAWVDRMRRRPVMIAGNLLRTALLASVPVAAALDVLSLGQLYVVVFAVGVCTVFFDVAYQAYLPALIGRAQLVPGNGRLEASRSVAYTVGPAVAGYLVEILTAPAAMLVDAASFVLSAWCIAAIGSREPEPVAQGRALHREMAAGLRLVSGDPALRALALYGAGAVLSLACGQAVGVVFLVRTIHLGAAGIGLLHGIGGVGSVLGALVAGPLAGRFGYRTTILAVPLVSNGFLLLVPLTGPGPRLALYAVGTAVTSCGIVAFNVVAVAFRQRLCPDHLLGRLNATMRFLTWGTFPVGALIGGALGTAIGPRRTLWLAAAGFLLSVRWLVASPLRYGEGTPGASVQQAPIGSGRPRG